MQTSSKTSEQTLRIVRFFLPRLGSDQIACEIQNEKRRLEHEARLRLEATSEAASVKIENDSRQLKAEISAIEARKSRNGLGVVLGGLALFLGIGIALEWSAGILLVALGVLIVCVCGVEMARANAAVARARQRLAELRRVHDKELEADIGRQEIALRTALGDLDARIGELVRLYEASMASEDEVVNFCGKRLTELRTIVAPALGLHTDQILDKRSAEIWAPTFMQEQDVPVAVLRDIDQSERDIRGMADDIIEPMRAVLTSQAQWDAFRKRVLPMLGLADSGEADNGRPCLNALSAARFSAKRHSYLAGHYFFQSIACSEDFIGLFRAYVNVLSQRVSHTFALQILYTDIVAIGIETAFSSQRFDLADMTIEQHTHTLTLELSSGTSYRMSGDAGSAAHIAHRHDAEVRRVMSQANVAFRDQVVNVRALIRDAKAARTQGVVGRT